MEAQNGVKNVHPPQNIQYLYKSTQKSPQERQYQEVFLLMHQREQWKLKLAYSLNDETQIQKRLLVTLKMDKQFTLFNSLPTINEANIPPIGFIPNIRPKIVLETLNSFAQAGQNGAISEKPRQQNKLPAFNNANSNSAFMTIVNIQWNKNKVRFNNFYKINNQQIFKELKTVSQFKFYFFFILIKKLLKFIQKRYKYLRYQ
ncbi:unnamed protein product [Paramecium primaurelia]|uniref:Uncharacterized protein n=1 Tax=Paramecium primaurelia TaxID=5886 RepID=A0A8S1P887_PARPR|nr:unnamed protein product [Paramecium primaurelia]